MNQEQKHPSLESIISYTEEPDSEEHAVVKMHLISCVFCRRDASVLQAALMQLISQSMQPDTAKQSLPEDVVADYVDERLTTEDRENVSERLANDPASMKAALHYAKYSELMRAALPDIIRADAESAAVTVGKQKKTNQQKNSIQIWLKKHLDTKWPVWLNLPVTAMVTSALILAVLIPQLYVSTQNEDYVVAVYQDNPVVVFSAPEDSFGLGFFNSAQYNEQPFEGLKLKIDKGGSLHIYWQEVDGASNYTLRLYLITEITRKQLADMIVDGTEATISDFSPQFAKRYEWELSGITENNQRFRSVGGFVFLKPEP